MRIQEQQLRLSATDLSNHLHCHHLTRLNLAVAHGERQRPEGYDPRAEVLRERGYEHEKRYLDRLRSDGVEVVEIAAGEDAARVAQTVDCMRRGVEAIAQGALAHDGWFGLPDVLLRVERPSDLGPFSYEAVDTKLARETRGATILQLCLYSELVEAAQGARPEKMHVVSPGETMAPQTYRVAEYLAYHRWIKRRLLAAVEPGVAAPATYPEPVEHCQVCAFWKECGERRREDDHLSLVAGAGRGQRRELEGRAIPTLERLAAEPVPLAWRPTRGAAATYERLREQARVQLEGRRREAPYHELLELEPGRGLARLPEPDRADVFFDFEGDAFVGTGGLEYLFGWVTVDAAGEARFEHLWAGDAEGERRAFMRFVDAMVERLAASPGFHIYHFTPYEPSALKRLMGRYATREAEVDRLLRAEVFVDLHSIVRQAVRAAVERYSLKDLEAYSGFERQLELPEARRAVFRVERKLELGQAAAISAAERELVLRYNRDDCLSTLRLRDWLEALRGERLAAGEAIERPEAASGEASEKIGEHQARVEALMARLTEGVPAEERERSRQEHASWLLAHLADYHRREKKVNWWERYRLEELGEEELLDEKAGIAGLQLVGEVEREGKARVPVHRYRFVPQEVKLRRRHDVRFGKQRIGELVDFDLAARTIDVKKSAKTADEHPPAVFLHLDIHPAPKPEAVLRFAEAVASEGWEAGGPGRAARDLLLRLPPRLPPRLSGPGPVSSPQMELVLDGPIGKAPGEDALAAAKRLAVALDRGVLPIQGPPGSGKTYTGARMAVELVRRGRKVGVSATSHRVMRNFLSAARKAAAKAKVDLACGHRRSPKEGDDPEIEVTTSYDRLRQALAEDELHLLAGTSWLWAREDFAEAVDVLFVDEAGQMALADVLAGARGARGLVLLGDPRQLDQPQQGSHPEGTHVSALEHLLGGAKTLPPGAGLFLEETYRLCPRLCEFTSEVFYEDRLHPVAGLENQRLEGPVLDGAGLWFLPVEHEGNQSASAEEVEAVGRLVERLADGSTAWTDKDGKTAPLELEQILLVAPYNAQVQALESRLPGARIGTVDRFQGQEAPVVIFSTATSSAELAPRGMEFLYDSSRLNVATSRAKGACVLVGSPRIFEPECRTPRQIKLANAFCRYLEVARGVGPFDGSAKEERGGGSPRC